MNISSFPTIVKAGNKHSGCASAQGKGLSFPPRAGLGSAHLQGQAVEVYYLELEEAS